jgi:hypothetical protein
MLRPLPFERATVIDAQGAVVLSKDAEQDAPYELMFTDQEIARIQRAENPIFVHNHPQGWRYHADDPRHAGYSFSLEDIFLACKARVAQMRAVSPGYRFAIVPNSYWREADWMMIETIFRGEFMAVNRDLTLKVLRGDITQATMQADLLHLTWARFSGLLGLTYHRFEE